MLAIVPARLAAATRDLRGLRPLPTAAHATSLARAPDRAVPVTTRGTSSANMYRACSRARLCKLMTVRHVPNPAAGARTILPAMIPGAITALLLGGTLTACGRSNLVVSGSSGAPSVAAVSNGRFVARVVLGHGDIVVTPPPGGFRPRVPKALAWTMFRSSDSAEGTHVFAILGLATVTVAQGAGGLAGLPAPAELGTTTTTPTTSTTTTPPTVPLLPIYQHRVAWVGISWGGLLACPQGASSAAKLVPDASEVAVIFDATTGHDVIGYSSGADPSCSGSPAAPSVVRPNELVSVPWQPVGPTSTAVRVTIPACGQYDGWNEVQGPGTQSAIEVVASVPFDPQCAATSAQSEEFDDVVPLGSSQQQLAHAALGPVEALRVLPGG